MSAGWRVTMEYEADGPLTCGGGADIGGQSRIGEVIPPGEDAPPETWAAFSRALAWATEEIARG